jgi:predicted transcriptional regulator
VRDNDKLIVREWGLSDDNSDVLVFGPEGKVLYSVDGKFSDAQVKEIVKVVWDNLP